MVRNNTLEKANKATLLIVKIIRIYFIIGLVAGLIGSFFIDLGFQYKLGFVVMSSVLIFMMTKLIKIVEVRLENLKS